ncbi:MAG: serine/threonine-protein kinase [Acidobacteriota bacterium]|nr:serine/threonine-protein kinase [Acidobacteriota bacterium]
MATDASVAPFLGTGTALGGYRIQGLIAVGGMATVYRALDERLGRVVALKVLRGGDSDARERFLREVRVVAGLQHANIVMLYGAGEEGDTTWAAMELLPHSLSHELHQKGRFSAADTCAAGRDACLGLEAAAKRGIVHRDVKPSNLLRDQSGSVKVADFGLAKDLSLDLHLTTPGVILGTPLYSSPEQALGKAVGVQSDLYSLGATLYHLVAGHPPFQSSNALDTLVRHAVEAPPPLPTDVPAALARLILGLLAKEPRQRPSTYAAVIASLDGCLDPVSEEPQPAPAEPSAYERGDGMSASLLGAARAAVEMGRSERARTLLEPIVQKRSPGWVSAAFLLASSLEGSKRLADAGLLLEQVAADATHTDDRALALWTLGRLAEQESTAALARAVGIYERIAEVSSTRFPRALLEARIERLTKRQRQDRSSAGDRDPHSS